LSFTLKEEHRLRMFKKKGVLRKIFGPKRDTIIGDWSKLNSGKFHDIYASPNVIWMIKSIRMECVGL